MTPQQAVGSLLITAYGARATGDTLVCDVPCGFGTDEGAHGLTVSAPGYAPRRVAIEARYARFEGGCPSFNAGSTALSVSLRRTP